MLGFRELVQKVLGRWADLGLGIQVRKVQVLHVECLTGSGLPRQLYAKTLHIQTPPVT